MRFHKRTAPVIFYSAIDPAGAGGSGSPAGTPAGAPTPNTQPGGQGVGQGGGFREQYFANVPDEVWTQVEPHIGNLNKHVTQLEQRYAPFKGYTEQDLQGLANFAAAFDRDPVSQWIRIAHTLQRAGRLDPELDLEHLSAIVSGQDIPEPNTPQQQQNGDIPPWAQQLMQKVEALEGGVNQFQTTHRQRVEDAALQKQLEFVNSKLKEGGIPEEAFSDEMKLAAYIAHRGNAQAAVASMVNVRNAMLKGYVKQETEEVTADNDLDLPNGVPKSRAKRSARQSRGMIPASTKAAAEQFLAGRRGSE